jgi:UDP-N-acetylmuramoylalanine--D-glutamate ligase
MELFFEVCPCRIIGITGSDGKTTTTTLTHLFLDTEFKRLGKGRAYVGGNIGQPLLPLANDMTENDVAIVELSSFQLQTMTVSPVRAAITNISPNHLNWHVDMDEYITAKCNICRHGKMEYLVVNADNDVTREIAKNSDQPLIYFSSKKSGYSEIVPFFKENCIAIYEENGTIYVDDGKKMEKILDVADIILPGRHNVENYMTAIALTYGLVSAETVGEVAREFKGVEHRLEFVREHKGVKYYNSSIDSSPSRTAAAVSAISKPPVIICGGADKGVPFDGLAKTLCTSVKAVVLTGASADKIMAEIEKCDEYAASGLRVERRADFRDAVVCASEIAEEGDIVLLSPACTSFDAFKNFEERGKKFKEIVNSIE